jgi:hypothetical protein
MRLCRCHSFAAPLPTGKFSVGTLSCRQSKNLLWHHNVGSYMNNETDSTESPHNLILKTPEAGGDRKC